MRIYITDKNETRKITLKVWDNKTNNGWSPDCFGDLADTLPTDYPISYEDSVEHDASCAMTDKDYRETVEWWEDEVAKYNAHKRGWFTENLSEDERGEEWAKDLEYGLFAD